MELVQREKISRRKAHVNQPRTIEATLSHGQRVIDFLQDKYGKKKSDDILHSMIAELWPKRQDALGTGGMIINVDTGLLEPAQGEAHRVRIPWGFWREFLEDEMRIRFDQRQKMRFCRALKYVVLKKASGATSLSALRGERRLMSSRASGGAMNSRKACGLCHALLQYFVDHIQRLCARSEPHLLMKEARNLRAFLIDQGYPEKTLPKLIGNAGATWFFRWRRMYGIHRKMAWM